ncbi:MAG: hypothetical protein H0X33_11165 [Taibaiella sp.]|nr:hypothetical protein [Taibaiella sp.]
MKTFYRAITIAILYLFIADTSTYALHSPTWGAEITYKWLRDSTYRIYYHHYHDCSGVPHPDSIRMCYTNTCSAIPATLYLHEATTATLPAGVINGAELVIACPSFPTNCAGGVVPGEQEWWYTKDITLSGKCDHWIFSVCLDSSRLGMRNVITCFPPHLDVPAVMWKLH